MFAVLAFICFVIAFILGLMEIAAGNWNLLALGLAFLALHLFWPVGFDVLGSRRRG